MDTKQCTLSHSTASNGKPNLSASESETHTVDKHRDWDSGVGDAESDFGKSSEGRDVKDGKQSKPVYSYEPVLGWLLFLTLTALGLYTRLRALEFPTFVTWDEAHFGKFAGQYLRREFYHDVHPPGGKMLLALFGHFAAWNGTGNNFNFESGKPYPEGFQYPLFRAQCALVGSLAVPFAWAAARMAGMGLWASSVVGVGVLFDNSLVAISRLILLDPPLIAFTTMSVFGLMWIRRVNDQAFSFQWWSAMAFTGLCLGLTCSVKWVGLFVTALIGLHTAWDLWQLLGDKAVSVPLWFRHLVARALCLIVLPLTLYTSLFFVHFHVLSKTGPGDAIMPSLFQAQLEGSKLADIPIDVAYGSSITIKNAARAGGLLHSHPHLYPTGSSQQQITAYSHHDSNNNWTVLYGFGSFAPPPNPGNDTPAKWPEFLRDGSIIRLKHENTQKLLHSHRGFTAPVTRRLQEVTGYGSDQFQDINDLWKIEVVKDAYKCGRKGSRIRALYTTFVLRHVITGCLLRASVGKPLPEWGFSQTEIGCDMLPEAIHDINTHWNVEGHVNEQLPPASSELDRNIGFTEIMHLNAAMLSSNNGLIPSPDKPPDHLASRALDWPLLARGVRVTGWQSEKHKVYLVGNPAVYWTGAGALGLLSLLVIWFVLSWRRGSLKLTMDNFYRLLHHYTVFVFGWILHFIPFVIMTRVTYLHHYFPCLVFAVMSTGACIDWMSRLGGRYQKWFMYSARLLALAYIITTTYVFYHLAPLSYGAHGPSSNYSDRKYRAAWHID